MTMHFKPSAFNDAHATTANLGASGDINRKIDICGIPPETFASLTVTVMRMMGQGDGASNLETEIHSCLSALVVAPITRVVGLKDQNMLASADQIAKGRALRNPAVG